ncbi:hypothetical protein [Enterococcus olivae]
MSVGMYLASDRKLNVEKKNNTDTFYSLDELKKFDNSRSIISDIKSNLELNIYELDPKEKIFTFLNDNDKHFQVEENIDIGAINSYSQKPYIYYIDVFDWNLFYPYLSEYLKNLNSSFELWKIWEDEIDLESVEIRQISKLDTKTLSKIFGRNDFLNPIVGIYA